LDFGVNRPLGEYQQKPSSQKNRDNFPPGFVVAGDQTGGRFDVLPPGKSI
jgi:hypothetical protein